MRRNGAMDKLSLDVDIGAFQEQVIDASHQRPVLVDFWAEWCAPCRLLKPVLEELALEYGGRFRLAKVNSDKNQELAARYGVRGIPTVKAFLNGQPVKEFTGALPAAEIRAFIDGLMPSPAEPLRVAAVEARARGEAEVARSLLNDAAQVDPGNETVQLDLAEILVDLGNLESAREMLDAQEHKAKDATRVAALRARLKLMAAGSGGDPATLKARIEANAADLDARLQLANSLARADDFASALDQLLEIVRRDRAWRDEIARRTMLDLFTLLGADPRHDDLIRDFRVRLARTLH
jgi:putative thioredoxin